MAAGVGGGENALGSEEWHVQRSRGQRDPGGASQSPPNGKFYTGTTGYSVTDLRLPYLPNTISAAFQIYKKTAEINQSQVHLKVLLNL